MNDIPWAQVMTVLSALVGGSGLFGVIYTQRQTAKTAKEKAQLDLDKAKLEKEQADHKIERESLAAQIAAQATAQSAVDVERERQETVREVGADQVDLARGSTALDRIRELETKLDILTRDLGRRDAAVTHWKDATLELARYARQIEDGFNLERAPRVSELLLGTDAEWTAEVVAAPPAAPPQPLTIASPAIPTLPPLAPIVPLPTSVPPANPPATAGMPASDRPPITH